MLHVVSKIGIVSRNQNQIYELVSDFRNIVKMIPPDKINNIEADENYCKFSIEKAGEIELNIIEKEPMKTIKIQGKGGFPQTFFFWIQLKEISAYKTAIRLTLKSDVNMMIKMAVKKPLKNALDSIIDSFAKI